jgi:hypothetical protein
MREERADALAGSHVMRVCWECPHVLMS